MQTSAGGTLVKRAARVSEGRNWLRIMSDAKLWWS